MNEQCCPENTCITKEIYKDVIKNDIQKPADTCCYRHDFGIAGWDYETLIQTRSEDLERQQYQQDIHYQHEFRGMMLRKNAPQSRGDAEMKGDA